MLSRLGRRRKEAGKDRLMGRVREITGRMPQLPSSAGQPASEVGRQSIGQGSRRDVVAERVERNQQHVVRADERGGREHGEIVGESQPQVQAKGGVQTDVGIESLADGHFPDIQEAAFLGD
jgi:hypothetical protein